MDESIGGSVLCLLPSWWVCSMDEIHHEDTVLCSVGWRCNRHGIG